MLPDVMRNCVVGSVREMINANKILATKPRKKTMWSVRVQMRS